MRTVNIYANQINNTSVHMCNQPYIFILTQGPKVNRAKSHPQQIKVQKRPNYNKYMQSDH